MSSEDLGRVIVVWSPIHRQGGVSATAAMLASYYGEVINEQKTSDRVLLMTNQMTALATAGNYLTNETMVDGLSEVVELALSENLIKATDIRNSTFGGVSCIDILGSGKKNSIPIEHLSIAIPSLLNMARTGYRYIIVDAEAGCNDISTLALLRNCDCIVACLPQDKFIFDKWIRHVSDVYLKEVEDKPSVIVIGEYYDYMHLQFDKMVKELSKGKDDAAVAYINLNDEVHKAISKRNIGDFIKSQKKSKNPDCALDEIEYIVDLIDYKLEEVVSHEEEMLAKKEAEIRENNRKYLQEFNETDDGLYDEGDEDNEYDFDEDADNIENDINIEVEDYDEKASTDDTENTEVEVDTDESKLYD